MNQDLSTEIIKHVLANFLIIPSKFIDSNSFQSLCSDSFMLKEKLSFLSEDGKKVNNKIWGCELSFASEQVKIIIGDCSQDSSKELCMVIHLSNSPSYGLYICLDSDDKPLIACMIDSHAAWMPCNTFLQATFLAGMEQIKEFFVTASKLNDYNEQHLMLLSLIRFYNSLYDEEDLYERQEI